MKIEIKAILALVFTVVTLMVAMLIVSGPLAKYGRKAVVYYGNVSEKFEEYTVEDCRSLSGYPLDKEKVAFLVCLYYYGVCGFGEDNAIKFTPAFDMSNSELSRKTEAVCNLELPKCHPPGNPTWGFECSSTSLRRNEIVICDEISASETRWICASEFHKDTPFWNIDIVISDKLICAPPIHTNPFWSC